MGESRGSGPLTTPETAGLGDIRTAITHLKCALTALDRTDAQIAAIYAEMALSLCIDEMHRTDITHAG